MIPPGSAIGILGGGQLGRMLALAAAPLGYPVHIYSPDASGPAADVCARWVRGAYDDTAALLAFAAEVAVVTYEFENVAAEPLAVLEAHVPVRPPLRALATAQDRIAEKRFAEQHGARTARWAEVPDRPVLNRALAAVGTPAILKTTRWGYDGKGQARLAAPADADAAWAAIGGRASILERMLAFEAEFSIIAARGSDGTIISYPATGNVHRDGILHRSVVPAPPAVAPHVPAARALVERMLTALGYIGVLAVEFFATADGPVFNEMAPRVHNSGHWTIEGASTSQFAAHLLGICGHPLHPPVLRAEGVEMVNLIGDEVLKWPRVLAERGAHLHLYGKREARRGRKMGHVTRLADRT